MKPPPRHRRRRTRRVIICAAAGALAVAGTLAGLQWAAPGPASADEYTISQSLSRDGWDNTEGALSPAAVSGKTFGQILDVPVNGQVYAQPLNVGANVLVATEDDYVYSINRNSGQVNWSTQLGAPWATAAETYCSHPTIKPYVGVTSTPVYDPATGTLYAVGLTSGPPGDDSDLMTTTPQWELFAVNESTGALKWSKVIGGQPDNTTATKFAFNPIYEMGRPGLLLLNGSVYMGFGALCDEAVHPAYFGYVAGVNTTTQAQSLWVDQTGSNGALGGIWQGGGGLVSDGTSIFVATGNGGWPAAGLTDAQTSSVDNFAQSVVKLTPQNGTLQPTDFFSPANADQESPPDWDLGSGGPIILPFTTSSYPGGLIATAGKDARIFLLNEALLGGRSSTETSDPTAVYVASPGLVDDPQDQPNGGYGVKHGLWGHMAAIAGTGPSGQQDDYIYYQGAGWNVTDAGSDPLYVLKFDPTNPAKPVLSNIGKTADIFGYSSGSPAVTSSGNAMTSALVWEVYAANSSGANGALRAYSALPNSSGTLQQVFSGPIGNAAEFTTPATSSSRVYVGARNDGTTATCPTNFESATYVSTDSVCVGHLHEFGVKAGVMTASATSVNLGHVALGQSATRTVTLTNTGDAPATISGLTTPAVPFGTPAALAVGQKIPAGSSVTLPITFTPQAIGTITGKYVVTTTDGFTTRALTITVGGVGAPAASGTTWVPSPGGGWTLNGNSLMTGSTLQLNSAAVNQVGSAVFYQPVPSNGLHAKFTVRMNGGSGGDGLTFSLLNPASATTARGYGSSQLGFGGLNGVAVVLGTRQDSGFPSANFIGIATSTAGGHLVLRASTTKIPNLRSGFPVITVAVAGSRVSVGINGKTYLTASVPVPSTVMPAFTAANGAHGDVHDVGSETITTTAGTLPQPGGGWSYNGNAGMSGSDSVLTAPTASQHGSVVYTHPVATTTFSATFGAQLNGGSGGDGETLALLNPGTATSLGANASGLGFAGLSGLAVALGTQQVNGAPSSDWVGIETAASGGTPTLVASTDLSGLASPINLRSGTHLVTVTVASGTVTVSIDGRVVLTHAMTVPSTAYVAFTGSTGSMTDRHYVRNAAIAAG